MYVCTAYKYHMNIYYMYTVYIEYLEIRDTLIPLAAPLITLVR